MPDNKFKEGWLGGKTSLRISSPYGMREHPITHKMKPHYGIDIAVASGTPIYAPFDGIWGNYNIQKDSSGKVIGAGLYGWMVYTNGSGEKYQIVFMHLTKKADGIRSGTEVKAGVTILGYTGGDKTDPTAGSSTGAHLHLEIHKNVGRGITYTDSTHAINPINWLNENLTGNVGANEFNKQEVSFLVPSNQIDNSATEWETENEYVYEKKYANGIWQIVKVLIDKDVRDKQVYDSSISTMTGSLANFFNKVCQKPMVEFFGDTIGSQYYFFVRKPPFDSVGVRTSKVAYEIEMKDVIKYSITKNTANIYSWYQYIPQAELLVAPQLQQYVPAVFFKEYAEMWGSKPLSVQSNYYTYAYAGKNNKDGGQANFVIRNALLDFRYIIESNAYNPFLYNADVVLFGIRPIKRGTFVTFNGRKFYVEGVGHNLDFNGNMTTQLSLSHGMDVRYIEENVLPNGDRISYFNIIDFGNFDELVNKIKFADWPELLSSWKVNYDSFGFFLRHSEDNDRFW
jgi:hypothetical protein